jgi:hypothetical protein
VKNIRLALLLTVISFIASGAHAASMTMMQFGSFETRAEAEKRLSEISKKHAAELGNLSSSIREVKLPPDNLTVYRTQAGPVENRSVAQTICSKLASSGDECYIVQTAMVAASDMKKPEVTARVEPVAVAPIAAELNDVKKEAIATTQAAPDLTSKLSSLQNESSTSSNLPELSSLKQEAPVSSELAVVAAEPSPDMKAALDKAVANEASTDKAVTQAAKQEMDKKPSRTFWSRLNPFSSDEPKQQQVVETKPSELNAESAPIEQVSQKSMEAPIVVAENSLKADEIARVAPAASAPNSNAVVNAAPAAASPANARVAFDSTPVIMQAAPMQLPPPPAPLKARDREMLMSQQQQSMVQKPESLATPPALAPAADGSVQVEEAKRVPVTQASDMAAPIAVAPVAPVVKPAPLQPDVSLSPSATNGQKTVWAQVGPFNNADEALAFWLNYRQANPDFPVVRVRTTSAYQQQLKGIQRTWLRVGPVMRDAFVKSLCSSISPETKLRCGTVSDLGIAVPNEREKRSPFKR